jgi:hypothetical protein
MLYVLCVFNFTKKPPVCRGEKTENENDGHKEGKKEE